MHNLFVVDAIHGRYAVLDASRKDPDARTRVHIRDDHNGRSALGRLTNGQSFVSSRYASGADSRFS